MSDEHDALWRRYNAARDRLTKAGSTKQAQGIENQYGMAYQALVRAGLVPQIAYMYRVPKGNG